MASFGYFLFKHTLHKPKSKSRYVNALTELFFGVSDLHSHIRWRAVKEMLAKREKNVEVGAGAGIMSFNFILAFKKQIKILSYNDEQLVEAKAIAESNNTLSKYATITKDDAERLDSCGVSEFDQALIIDVLEHVKKDEQAVNQLNRILKTNGQVVVSVPTPYYPHYFGNKFAKDIGHLRHYSLNAIREIFESHGFSLKASVPYTYRATAALCHISYVKMKQKPRVFAACVFPFLLALSFITERLQDDVFCSLSLVFEKVAN
jgi:ubiquinone/menaquinone biosynthesis C-methylase UbiE